MHVEIINTGSELMLGFTLNTHQQWLCRELGNAGFIVTRQTAIADTGDEIQQAVRESLSRADLVITTGGLGPTSDDITRDMIAELLGRALHEDAAVVEHIQKFFTGRKRPMPEQTRVQALIPEGAAILMNAHGTAPGLVMETAPGQFRLSSRASLLVMLPGPPRELRPMFTDQVLPLLHQKLGPPEAFICRVWRTTGLGESIIEARIAAPLRALTEAGLDIGYCAHVGSVDLRLSARGAKASRLVEEAERIVHPLLAEWIFATDDEPLERRIIQMLTERSLSLGVAESCTGGLIAHRLTNVPGASVVFRAGLVTYSNEAKEQLLGVRSSTLQEHGAVSEATAREMVDGARARLGVDCAIAVTGIAGPDGGTAEKPVGTVFIAVTVGTETRVVKNLNSYDRETFKSATSQQALDLLRRMLPATR